MYFLSCEEIKTFIIIIIIDAVQLEDEDRRDLAARLTAAPTEKVPEEMLCLWEQQKKSSTRKANTDIDGI